MDYLVHNGLGGYGLYDCNYNPSAVDSGRVTRPSRAVAMIDLPPSRMQWPGLDITHRRQLQGTPQ
jgi:hypothetical protein